MKGKALKILLIEDNPGDVRLIKEMLKETGPGFYDLIVAERFDEGMTLITEQPFDVLLLDLNLPDSKGIETLIRAHRRVPEIPIVVITGLEDIPLGLKSVNEGAEYYLIKGQVNSNILATTLEYAIEHRKGEEALHRMEDSLRNIIERNADGIVIVDKNGIIRFINPAGEALIGRKSTDLLGESFGFPIVAGEIIEIDLLGKNGEIAIAEMRVVEVEWEGKKAFLASLRDITERMRAQEKLRESEERYRSILDSIGEAYFEVDLGGSFIFFNDSLPKMSGYSRDEITGMNSRDYITPESYKQVFSLFNKTYRTGNAIKEVGYEIIKKDGSHRFHEVSASLMQDETCQPIGFRGIIRDVTEQKKIEAELIQTRNFLQNIFDSSAEGIITTDLHGNIISMSPRVKDILGYDQEDLIGKKAYSYYSNGKEDAKAIMNALTEKGELRSHEIIFIRKDGRLADINISTSLLKNEKGETIGTLGILSDITEEKKLEAQLQQAQKMEAVGRLTGGIAHDFNNILTTIIGNADIILMEVPKGDPKHEDLEEIKVAGDRAASLTRQLLAFSRRQVLQPEIININETVGDMDKMLRRIIGEDIDLSTILSPDLGMVEADISQIEQVIMNLVVNARDAMPEGGKITIETENVYLDDMYAQNHIVVTPGPYVMLIVSDTGIGMTKRVQSQVFEPFFSTKEKGKGTGLGLSTVYGIIKQSKGYIWVYSELGQGSTFKIYLPSIEGKAKVVEKEAIQKEFKGGSETILLVEDNEMLRNFARRVLRKAGYNVLEARDGTEAIDISNGYKDTIQLLLTDVVMPGINGRDLAEHLKPLRPDIQVIYTSGYTDNAIARHGILEEGFIFLQKPFTTILLLSKIRETLDKR